MATCLRKVDTHQALMHIEQPYHWKDVVQKHHMHLVVVQSNDTEILQARLP